MSTSERTRPESAEAPPAAGPVRLRWFAAILVAAALAAYANSLRGPFFFDDVPAILENPTIVHLGRIGQVLSPPSIGGTAVGGRPVINLSFALNYALSGTGVWSYHAFNLAIHILAGLALFGLARRAFRGRGPAGLDPDFAGFALAVLWLVHPLLTESVTSVVQRTESLMGLFYLLTLYCLARGADVQDGRVPAGKLPPGVWYTLSFLACLLGMASKEVMVSAPILALLYDRTFLAGSFREAWRRRRGAHLSLAAAWALLAFLMLRVGGTRGGAAGFGLGVSPWRYALTQCRAILLYLRLSFWPHPLIINYGETLVGGLSAVWPQALVLLGLLVATGWALWRRPALGFAGAWFFLILAPSSSVVPLVTQTIAEHRMYLPLAAVLGLAVAGLLRLARTRGPLAVGILAAAGVVGTAARNSDYRSVVAIWQDTVDHLPGSPGAHNNLGNALQDAGRVPEAQAEFEAALRIDPDYAQANYNLANLLLSEGRTYEAIEHYLAVIRKDPTFRRVHGNFGIALLRIGQVRAAIHELSLAAAAEPGNADRHYNLAGALAAGGDLVDAIGEYRRALAIDPGMANAHYNLATALAQSGRYSEAAEEFQAVLRIRPSDPQAREGLARLQGMP